MVKKDNEKNITQESKEKDKAKNTNEKGDPLIKLKEEREKLIQWSKKLKNNNCSFVSSDKIDTEKSEKVYSSNDDYYDEKDKMTDNKRDNKNNMNNYHNNYHNNNSKNRKKGIHLNNFSYNNLSDQKQNDIDHIVYESRQKNKNSNYDNNIVHEESANDDYNINKIRRNKKKDKNYNSKNNSFENNSSESNNQYYIFTNRANEKDTLNNVFKNTNNQKHESNLSYLHSDDEIFMDHSFDENKAKAKNKIKINNSNNNNNNNNEEDDDDNMMMKPNIYHSSNDNFINMNEMDNSSNILKEKNHNFIDNNNNYNKILNDIYLKNNSDIIIREPFFKTSKYGTLKEKKENFDEQLKGMSNEKNMKNISLDNKKKIKLTKKKKKQSINFNSNNKHDISNTYDQNNISNNPYNIIYGSSIPHLDISSNVNKLSNESVKTYLPTGSFVNSKDNSTCTTILSNNDMNTNDNNLINSGTKLKNIQTKKMINLLENKVRTLESKKHNLNDKMKDLHDNAYMLIESKEKDNLTIQHYETLIKNLESKYNKLFNMYQELDEHRISYVDAYREKQTKIENLCAILQIKSEENLKLTQEMNIINKKNEQLQGQIYEYIKDVEDKETDLNKKKEECVILKNNLETLKIEKDYFKKQLEEKTKQYDDLENNMKIIKEQNEHIKNKFQSMGKSNDHTNNFFIPKIDNLIYILNKMLQVFKLNEQNILDYATFFKQNATIIEEKLLNNDNICNDIIQLIDKNLVNPIINVVNQRDQQYIQHQKELKMKFDDDLLKIYEKNINNVELANKHIEDLKKLLKSITIKNDRIKQKALLLSYAQGRLNQKPLLKEIKNMNTGTLLFKCKYNRYSHKPVQIYMKIVDNKYITWTKNLTGKKGFKKRKLIDIQDVINVDYGLNSRPVYWLIEKQNQKKLQKKKLNSNQFYENNPYKLIPYNCFTIYTKERTYDFFSDDDEVVASWVIGLGLLSYPYNKSPSIQSRSEFIIKRVQLKLKLYCIKNNINYVKLWKNAIKKTQQQMEV
ncbi:conserved Plasmodium protein, unknown function [Plasmodium sp. gorilla clade G2]|uniref:conserved Plasmodium protein, unknown function n=1 Tax=Plasmodium sp. gorilla clade G2 TaxID=880535 RepID=UPI000D2156A8|nr:conserved Plasmodium protein, unknown function [Plasmodium sp. gorilla clade G2]SOV16033.1 conserved Plasmodium protein, unknown function [Plasmodium sp. gorilla clade G2]